MAGPPGAPAARTFTAAVRRDNEASELNRLAQFVHAFAEAAALPPPASFAVDLALTEWLTNIPSYGTEPGKSTRVHVRLRVLAGEVEAIAEDDGPPFNPLEVPPVDTTVPMEERPIGGLGIHLMRGMMDRIEYRRDAGANRLRMTKHLVPPKNPLTL